jgi:2-keto-4-pentenoate hydratase/2-oxohepta-3-ene-1,7-dioic acid hydratase in catechol pathway
MRLANINGRLSLIRDTLAVDVAAASHGMFGPDPQQVLNAWDDFRAWLDETVDLPVGVPYREDELGAPVPNPRQVFAVGLNYHNHARESGFEAPRSAPPIFTKFLTSIAGPFAAVTLPDGGQTDWEVELVAVVGRTASHIKAGDAWDYLAGVTAGQDLSERVLQMAATPPQFSMGKSYPGFGPIGPFLVTPDELGDPDDLEISCTVNGESVQKARTSDMIFNVPELVEYLSRVTSLLPGDLIFTGTPGGVGIHRDPPRWLAPGDVLVSAVEGVGKLCNEFTAAGG